MESSLVCYTIIYGREPPAPAYFDVLLETGQVRTAANPRTWTEQTKALLNTEVADAIRQQSENRKARHRATRDEGRKATMPLKPSDVVWMANKKPLPTGQKPKLARRQDGMFVVVQKTGPVTYVVRRLAAASGRTRKLHIDLLKPVRTSTSTTLSTAPLPPTVASDEDETDDVDADAQSYDVETVTDMRLNEGQLQFLVQWSGYPGQDTWEDEHQLDCPDRVLQYLCTSSHLATSQESNR